MRRTGAFRAVLRQMQYQYLGCFCSGKAYLHQIAMDSPSDDSGGWKDGTRGFRPFMTHGLSDKPGRASPCGDTTSLSFKRVQSVTYRVQRTTEPRHLQPPFTLEVHNDMQCVHCSDRRLGRAVRPADADVHVERPRRCRPMRFSGRISPRTLRRVPTIR